ncbi:MAG: hypothetical protein GY950_28370 [bacterium]|nr:hypothetical protein [bacterium]
MHVIRLFFQFELKRLFWKKRGALLLASLFCALCFLQSSINTYKDTIHRREKFREIEKLKVETFHTYTQVGTYGIRVLFVPAPVSVFFMDSCVIPDDVNAYVDSGERLKIFNPLIGKNIFKIKKTGFVDFSGILVFSITLLSLFFGYDAHKRMDFLKSLSTIAGSRPLFFSILLSRMSLALLYILASVGAGVLLLLVNGLAIPIGIHLLIFILKLFLLSLFGYSLGAYVGSKLPGPSGIVTILVCWFVLLIVAPIAVNSFIAGKADMITPLYELELEKLKTVMNFEKRAIEDAGTFKYGKEVTEARKKVITSYWKNEFKKLQALEEAMRAEMARHVRMYQLIGSFIPTVSYQSVTGELSSRGYENLLRFYKYVQELKREFVKYYIDNVYFSNFSKIVPFIKADENTYHSVSGVPGYFALGIALIIFYSSLFQWRTYARYKKEIYKPPVRPVTRENIKAVHIDKKGYEIIRIIDNDLVNRLYNILSGLRGPAEIQDFKAKFFVRGTDVTSPHYNPEFLYLCRRDSLPGDIKVKNFLELICSLSRAGKEQTRRHLSKPHLTPLLNKTFQQLEPWEKSAVLLEVLNIKQTDVYLVNNLAKDVPKDLLVRFKDLMEQLGKQNKTVIYLTTQSRPEPPPDKDHPGYNPNNDYWSNIVDGYKKELKENPPETP